MSVRTFIQRLHVYQALPLGLVALAGCLSEPFAPTKVDLGPAPVIVLVSGSNQTVTVGSEFDAPVRVQLTNADGTAQANKSVLFHFLEPVPGQFGGGIITARTTDSEGMAEIRFTPTRAGSFTVRAYREECAKPSLKFCEEIVVRAEVTATGTAVAGDS